MSTFKAVWAEREGEKGQKLAMAEIGLDDLMEGDVTVRVAHSTVNYKDGLAITGRAPIMRKLPLIPGIDFAGTVETSDHADFRPGDQVILNGWGVGETHYGAYAGRARVNGDWLIARPEAFTPHQAMAIGTAGYTAMLSVLALERAGLTPDAGPAIVTGANGGVGTIAVSLLSKLGYRVIASTGRPQEADFLKALGAAEIIDRAELSEPGRPLGKERWACGIDSVGSVTLANVLAQTMQGGSIAACGLAQGMDLPATVAPFILRGVSLLGIDSVMAPRDLRETAWARLAADLDPQKLESLSRTIGFDDIIPTAKAILDGQVRGRVVVDLAR